MSTQPITHIRLDDEEWDAVRGRLTRINDLIAAFEEDFVHRVSGRMFSEMRGYLGGIEEARRTISELVHGGVVDTSRHPSSRVTIMTDDEAAALIEPIECPICDPESPDACNAHGITITDEVAQARTVDGKPTWYQHNIAADRLVAQLQRGLITRDEFDAAMAALNGEQVSS